MTEQEKNGPGRWPELEELTPETWAGFREVLDHAFAGWIRASGEITEEIAYADQRLADLMIYPDDAVVTADR